MLHYYDAAFKGFLYTNFCVGFIVSPALHFCTGLAYTQSLTGVSIAIMSMF
jgi:hypothetical protein